MRLSQRKSGAILCEPQDPGGRAASRTRVHAGRVVLKFRGTQLSSDAGLLVMCELNNALGLAAI